MIELEIGENGEGLQEVIKELMAGPCKIKLTRSVQRTPPQNNAIHQWCEDVANYFNDAGLDMRAVLKPEANIPWTKESVKTMIWHEIQLRMFPDAVDKNGKPSTAKLKKDQVSQIEQVIARHFSDTRGLTLPVFPSARP